MVANELSPLKIGKDPREMKTDAHTKTCTWTLTADLFIIAPAQMSSVGERTNCDTSICKDTAQEQTMDTHNRDESPMHYVRYRRPEAKGYIPHDPIHRASKAKITEAGDKAMAVMGRRSGENWTTKGQHKRIWGVIELICVLTVVMIHNSYRNSYE